MALSVSVALCTYNGERFLREQLDSIAAQTIRPSELVVTDDASSDGTVELLEAFASTAPFPTRVLRNPRNKGSTASFERTITACTSALIALCDQDDVWRPTKLEKMGAAMEADGTAGYAFTDAEVVDETLRPLGLRVWETVGFADSAWRDFRGPRQVEQLLQRTRVTGATMMIRAERLPLCLPFPRGVVHDRWLATMLSGVGAYGIALDEPLIEYRQHGAQQIGVAWGGRPRTLRAQMTRDFVLKQRRRIRVEQELGRAFVVGLAKQIAEGTLTAAETTQAQHSRVLANGWVQHVDARVGLTRASVARVCTTIGSELFHGSYSRYSGGMRAVFSDLLYCARDRRSDVDGVRQ